MPLPFCEAGGYPAGVMGAGAGLGSAESAAGLASGAGCIGAAGAGCLALAAASAAL